MVWAPNEMEKEEAWQVHCGGRPEEGKRRETRDEVRLRAMRMKCIGRGAAGERVVVVRRVRG